LAIDLLVPGGFLRHFFADGTDNAPSGLAVVGEEGPELVNFRGGEQVIPSPQTKQILQSGNGGSVFNVTFNNMQDTTAFAMMKQMKGWQRSLAFNAVI
jgi:phage-related tail protein